LIRRGILAGETHNDGSQGNDISNKVIQLSTG